MRLCPCRFNLPLTDNDGQPIAAEVILDLQRELLRQFGGYTIHPTSKGRWQSRGGRQTLEAFMKDQDKRKKLVAEAKEIARRADSWISLSNALTDPSGGLIASYFPDFDERQSFLNSREYEQLDQLMRETIQRRGLYPRSSGGKEASAR